LCRVNYETDLDYLNTIVRANYGSVLSSVFIVESRAIIEPELNRALPTIVKDLLEKPEWPSVGEVG